MAIKNKGIQAGSLSSPSDLKRAIDSVLRSGIAAGADETEVQLDETIDALTRFANNAIHQNVAEHGVTVSVRTVVNGRTARATTNRLNEDSLPHPFKSSLPVAHIPARNPPLPVIPRRQR